MVVIAADSLPQDSGGRYFNGVWVSGTGLIQRGANSDGTYADARVVLYDSSGNALLVQTAGGDLEGNTVNHVRVANRPNKFNGTTWDRERNNVEGTLLAAAARTSSTFSTVQTNHNNRGLMLFLKINTTPNNAETLTPAVLGVDPVTTSANGIVGYTALTASVLGASPGIVIIYTLYPGAVETIATSFHEVQALPVPRSWQIVMTHSAGGSWNYSLGYSYIA